MTAEYVAAQSGPWLPGVSPVAWCCRRYEACPPCARGDGHRSCWGESMRWRHGPHAVAHHEHAIGRLLGYRRHHLLYVYETGYAHRTFCGCAESGHPGVGTVDTPEGRGDLRLFERRGIPVRITYSDTCPRCGRVSPPVPDRAAASLNARLHAETCRARDTDDHGTPPLFDMETR